MNGRTFGVFFVSPPRHSSNYRAASGSFRIIAINCTCARVCVHVTDWGHESGACMAANVSPGCKWGCVEKIFQLFRRHCILLSRSPRGSVERWKFFVMRFRCTRSRRPSCACASSSVASCVDEISERDTSPSPTSSSAWRSRDVRSPLRIKLILIQKIISWLIQFRGHGTVTDMSLDLHFTTDGGGCFRSCSWVRRQGSKAVC